MPDIDMSQVQRIPLSCDKKLMACIDYAKNHFDIVTVLVFMALAFAVGFLLRGWVDWKKK